MRLPARAPPLREATSRCDDLPHLEGGHPGSSISQPVVSGRHSPRSPRYPETPLAFYPDIPRAPVRPQRVQQTAGASRLPRRRLLGGAHSSWSPRRGLPAGTCHNVHTRTSRQNAALERPIPSAVPWPSSVSARHDDRDPGAPATAHRAARRLLPKKASPKQSAVTLPSRSSDARAPDFAHSPHRGSQGSSALQADFWNETRHFLCFLRISRGTDSAHSSRNDRQGIKVGPFE